MKNKITILFLLIASLAIAQSNTQNIRGVVIDKETKITLPGAAVVILKDSTQEAAVSTNEDGAFRIENVSIGRKNIKISMVGYKTAVVPVIVSSGKECIVTAEIEEAAFEMQEVVIEASKKGEVANEMSMVSSRTFSVEEANRYAGSRGEPARMASNFAGVQGSDDSRNDIVIRGNSPMGLLWRLEGLDIPNPNHFAIAGTAGGPLGILNNKVLANSEFYTGAFPAEYGNSIAGVFDIKMRNGNNEKHEFTGQLGFLGTEFTAEGPLSKKSGATYLINYRYATLKLFESLNISLGTSAVPSYQDGSFKFNFPLKDGSNLSFFGVGGYSKIFIHLSKFTTPSTELYGDNNRDQLFSTSMGVVGASYSKSFNANNYLKTVLARSVSYSMAWHDLIYRKPSFEIDSLVPIMSYSFREDKTYLNNYFTHKFSPRSTLKSGVLFSLIQYQFHDSLYNLRTYAWDTRVNFDGMSMIVQPFTQWKYKISDDLVFTTGVHAQISTMNKKSIGIGPRAGIKYTINPKQSISFGTGMHQQGLPSYIYLAQQEYAPNKFVQHNKGLGFMQSTHAVLTYDIATKSNLRFKTETYYQYLNNIPVSNDPKSSYAVINQGSGFTRFFPDTMVNKGTGYNYGIEFTAEKFFSQGIFMLFTTSLYNSQYKGNDGVTRSTDYNGNYILNALFGKEFKIKERNALGLSGKFTYAGGKRYSPLDTIASRLAQDEVVIDSQRNTLKYKDYMRLDIKINYRINVKSFTHEIALDLVNVLNTKNILSLSYDPYTNKQYENYQLGFLPLFYYRIDF